MRASTMTVGVFGALLLGGCASQQYGQYLPPSEIQQIRSGVTDKDDVQSRFGPPVSRQIGARGNETWHYVYFHSNPSLNPWGSSSVDQEEITISFHGDKVSDCKFLTYSGRPAGSNNVAAVPTVTATSIAPGVTKQTTCGDSIADDSDRSAPAGASVAAVPVPALIPLAAGANNAIPVAIPSLPTTPMTEAGPRADDRDPVLFPAVVAVPDKREQQEQEEQERAEAEAAARAKKDIAIIRAQKEITKLQQQERDERERAEHSAYQHQLTTESLAAARENLQELESSPPTIPSPSNSGNVSTNVRISGTR